MSTSPAAPGTHHTRPEPRDPNPEPLHQRARSSFEAKHPVDTILQYYNTTIHTTTLPHYHTNTLPQTAYARDAIELFEAKHPLAKLDAKQCELRAMPRAHFRDWQVDVLPT